MTPGEFEGEKFDGVMRDIVANHVALVAEGRAGPDVIVGDEKKDFQMAKTLLSRKAAMVQGAMIAYLMPKLAADAKVDLTSVFAGITNKNIVERKPIILNGVRSAVKGKLAMDADIGDLVKLLDAVSSAPVADSEDPIADPAVDPAVDPALAAPPVDPVPEAKDDDPTAAIMEFLQGKLTPEDLAQLQALMKPEAAADPAAAPPADPAAPPADPAAPPKDPAEDAEMDDLTANDQDDPAMQNTVSKPAMDAAIASAEARVIKTHRDIRDAERAVRPYVGDLAIACDSAESVYRHALKMLGVKGAETIHASALPAMLEMQPLPGARKTAPTLSMDAAAAKGFSDRFPETHRIRAI